MKSKAIVLSLMLAEGMLSASFVQAQGILGNMLDDYYSEQDRQGGGVMMRGDHEFSNGDLSITNQNFQALDNGGGGGGGGGGGIIHIGGGDDYVPLGSGIAILIGAGLGYVALTKKEEKQ